MGSESPPDCKYGSFRSSGFQSLLGKWSMCKFWLCNLMNFAAEGGVC